MTALLKKCPECGAPWPSDPDHALRGCGWLQGLSRAVSPTNSDIDIHDDTHGRDRFLRLEIKAPREPWPMQRGQDRLLRGLARQSNWTVLIIRGSGRAVDVYRMGTDGTLAKPIRTHVEAVRRAVDAWLKGSLWRDAEDILRAAKPEDGSHTCGWARVGGVWSCVQDFYAIGHRPDTSCGATLPDYQP
jgi:hypothetical protein